MAQKKQICASGVFILFSIFYLVCTASIKVVNVFGVTVVSSATIPRILGVLLLGLSSIQCWKSWQDYRKEKNDIQGCEHTDGRPNAAEGNLDVQAALAEAEANEEKAEVDRTSILQTVGCLVLFVLTMGGLGFMLSAFSYMVLQMTVLTKKEERKKKLLFIVILSAGLSASIYYLFTRGLSLMLPAGILG
mgnify:CR=1 FL=1